MGLKMKEFYSRRNSNQRSISLATKRDELRGRVTDERKANIEGADVRLRYAAAASCRRPTDGNGTYTFNECAAGDYVLEIRANGFASSSRASYHARPGSDEGHELVD